MRRDLDRDAVVDDYSHGAAALFDGDDPTQAVLRATGWAATPLGPVGTWPDELRAAIRTVMPSRVPMLLWWGPRLTQLYNDAFTPLIGDKHPRAIGQDAADCYAEAWGELGPLAESVLAGGGATYSRDLYLPYKRHGYIEETYWTFSYSPVRAGDTVGGVLVACLDTTSRVLAERRLLVLHELGGVSAAEVRSDTDACRAALAVLAGHRRDVPFGVAYLLDAGDHGDGRGELRVAASFGLAARAATGWRSAVRNSLGRQVVKSGQAQLVTGIRARFGPVVQPVEPGMALADSGMLVPLTDRASGNTIGALVLGMSPYREFDDEYRHFFELIAQQVSTAVTYARAYQSERKRAEALEALDRTKTRFLQNVSHEFRTPITLVLGPLGEVLHGTGTHLPPQQRAGLEAAERAALRLERLVTNLLQFTGTGGESQVGREPTDVTALTAECAAMFRPGIERAGLTLALDITDVPGLVQLDRETWVKIVSNLLSNAVKFTAAGTIRVGLRQQDENLVLTVADTGAGIPAAEIPRIFERFHQVPGTSARTREGAGIGLSLVAELVAELGGGVEVASTPGDGSTFTITVPVPAASAPGRESADAMAPVRAAVAETDSWLGPTPEPEPSTRAGPVPGSGSVLLVEDNPDMRAYLARLLRDDGWAVVAVADVAGALEVVEDGCDLVLSDIMMPGPDGLDLVRILRSSPATTRLPIVLLTARAGPDSAAEGLRAGADDYVVKPFDPVELLARVRVHHELARLREYALDQAERRAANLETALLSNRQIGTAIGILMHQRKITETEGFDLLRRASQRTNRKLRDVADEVVTTGTLPLLADRLGS